LPCGSGWEHAEELSSRSKQQLGNPSRESERRVKEQIMGQAAKLEK
jgi:hypothetical protein